MESSRHASDSPADEAVAFGAESRSAEYVVVARRYRPQTFTELVGQEQVSQSLSKAIESHRVGHAYLFTGARGVGKTSTARILAKALNCEHGPTPAPCNQCDICRGITSGEDVDVLEIDGASARGIDEIRQLRANVNVRPSRSRFKVYIIDEVHMFTREAFNALLKTLEEPPEHVKFIFCTTDPEKIPITVLSRCQRFDFPPVQTASIAERLRAICAAEKVEADPEALQLLARRAAGSMRDSQSLLEQLLSFCEGRITAGDVHRMLGTARGGSLMLLATELAERRADGALRALESAIRDGVDVGQLAEQLLAYFRDVLAATVGCAPDLLLQALPDDHPQLVQLGRRLGVETLLAIVQVLDQAVVRMRQSPHVRTLLEVALVRITRLENLEEIARLVAQLQAGTTPSGVGAEKKTADGAGVTGNEAAVVAPPSPPAPPPTASFSSPPSGAPARDERPPAPVAPRSSSAAPPVSLERASTPPPPRVPDAPSSAVPAPPRRTADPNAAFDEAAYGGADEYPGEATPPPAGEPQRPSFGAARPAETSPRAAAAFSPTTRFEAADPERAEASVETETEIPTAGEARGPALSASSAEAVWRRGLERLAAEEDMTADFAAKYSAVRPGGPNRIVVEFDSEYNKTYCERPERLQKLVQVLAAELGRPVQLELTVSARARQPAAPPKPAAATRRQRLREVEGHPLVARAKEMFDAEIVDVQEPRRTD